MLKGYKIVWANESYALSLKSLNTTNNMFPNNTTYMDSGG